MSTIAPDYSATTPAGQPLRFLVIVLLLWGCGRALMTNSILANGLTAAASAVVRADEPDSAGPVHASREVRVVPASAAPRLTASVEKAPRYGNYYGHIAASPHAGAVPALDRVPIVRAGQAPRASSANAYVQSLPILDSSAAIFNMIPVPRAAASTAWAVSGGSSPRARVSIPPITNEGVWRKEGSGDDRWSGSAWAYWRQRDASRGLGAAGQLGGAQAGVRIDRVLARIGGHVPLFAYGRASAALYRPREPEAALGLAVRPLGGPVPFTVGIERRFALDHSGRSAFALVAVTGLYPTHIGPIIAEGYAQGGFVGFARTDPFVDGRLSLAAPLDRKEHLRIGASLSGGAQPGLSRLDVGPVLEWRAPLGGGVNPRLIVEWRRRIAGRATPGSGVAVTLATDF